MIFGECVDPVVPGHLRGAEAARRGGRVRRAGRRETIYAAVDLVGCWLLETELRRAAHRATALTQEIVSEFLDGVDVYEIPASLYREAGLLPGTNLRSLHALHLAAAIRIGVDYLVTYDVRMIESARDLGLRVISPA